MNKETRYSYEKKIRQIKDENNDLTFKLNLYKNVCADICSACEDLIGENKPINMGWIINQFRRLWK
jgi:hypothetical protein